METVNSLVTQHDTANADQWTQPGASSIQFESSQQISPILILFYLSMSSIFWGFPKYLPYETCT